MLLGSPCTQEESLQAAFTLVSHMKQNVDAIYKLDAVDKRFDSIQLANKRIEVIHDEGYVVQPNN